MAISIGDAVLQIGADTSKLDKSLKSIGDKMKQTGKNLTLKLTAPLAAFGALAIKTAADFSKAMAKVNAVTGATTDQFEALNKQAKELGRTTMFTATQVAEAMSFMGMAGFDANEIMEAIPDTLNLAAAGALDMATAADIVTNVMAGFGLQTSQLTGTVDVLAKAFTSSNTDLVQLGEAMRYAAPIAKGFGLTFEETTAMLGLFSNAGIQASMAGTTLRGALVQLDNKSEEFGVTIWKANGQIKPMADILEQLESQGVTTTEMMALFGLRAGPGMTAVLSQGIESLREFTKELEDAGGTAANVAEVSMEGLHGSIIALTSAFEGLQLAIADEIAPGFQRLTDTLANAFRWFAGLPGPIKVAAVTLGMIAAAIGPLLWLTATLITSWSAVASSLIATKIAGLAVVSVIKIMVAQSVGVAAAIGLMAFAFLALAAGIAMVVGGLYLLHKNAKLRKAETRLVEEQQKAIDGLANDYRKAAEEAEALGWKISEAMWAHIELTELAIKASEEFAKAQDGVGNEYFETMMAAKELGGVLSEENEKWLEDMVDFRRATEAVKEEFEKTAESTAAAKAELEAYARMMSDLEAALRGVGNAGEVYFGPGGIREQMIGLGMLGPGISRAPTSFYADGGPILGPTALTSLRTGQTYAVAGEAGPEDVVSRGGRKSINLTIMMDGHVLARALGQPLVDEIILSTGIYTV